MTDRERLEKIIDKMQDFGVQQCDTYEDEVTHELYTSSENFIKNERIVDELLAEGVTFKKKRKSVRKLPCKCGAEASRTKIYKTQMKGLLGWKCVCLNCAKQTNWQETKNKALIEWNKLQEAKE